MRRWLPWLAAAVLIVGLLNFFWLLSETGVGGAPVDGVDPGWFRVHGFSIVLTHPLAMLGGAYLLFTVGFPDLMRQGHVPVPGASAAAIESSGDLIIGRRVAGRLGGLSLSGPVLKVDVHPGGLVLKPLVLMSRIGLRTEMLDGTVLDRSRARSSRLWIAHHDPAAPSPIMLYLDPDDPIAEAIADLAGHRMADPRDAARVAALDTAEIARYPTVMKVIAIAGFALTPVILIVGEQAVFDGKHSAFELVWIGGIVAITAVNAYRFFVRDRHRW